MATGCRWNRPTAHIAVSLLTRTGKTGAQHCAERRHAWGTLTSSPPSAAVQFEMTTQRAHGSIAPSALAAGVVDDSFK
jgi:hypothetical protein